MSGFGDEADDAWAQQEQQEQYENPDEQAVAVEGDFNNLNLQGEPGAAVMNRFEDDDFGAAQQQHQEPQQYQQMDENASWETPHQVEDQEEGSYTQHHQEPYMDMGMSMANGGGNGADGSAFYGAHVGVQQQEVPESVRLYQERHMAEIQEREQLNTEKQQATLQAAQAYLDAFHQERQSKIEAHLSQIKQQESTFFTSQETLKHSNPWAAVVELSDLHRMTEQKSKLHGAPSSAMPANAAVAVMSSSASVSSSSSRPGSAMGSPIVGGTTTTETSSLHVNRHQKDVSRMKQLLIELKNTAVTASS